MYDLKTKYLNCPKCGELVNAQMQVCPKCRSNLAMAALEVENVVYTSELFSPQREVSPESLVPMLGERLVEKGLLTESDLQLALEKQAKLAATGQKVLVGQLLVDHGFIDRETLDAAVFEQIFQMQETLKRNNRELEQRVQERTDELQRVFVKLSELNQLKTNFISNVSHELRMPLQFLVGYLGMLADGSLGSLSDEQEKAVTSLKSASDQLHGLIDNLLQFSFAARGDLPLDMTPLPLAVPVRTAVTQSMAKAHSREIDLCTEMNATDSEVRADREKITWVVEQLLDNAIKFTPPGGKVKVMTRTHSDHAIVAVADTGIGIPNNRLSEVFRPFHQLDSSITRRYRGTGLGLALAQSIVNAHGSKITVRSEEGRGSYFAFALPISLSQEESNFLPSNVMVA